MGADIPKSGDSGASDSNAGQPNLNLAQDIDFSDLSSRSDERATESSENLRPADQVAEFPNTGKLWNARVPDANIAQQVQKHLAKPMMAMQDYLHTKVA